jgi:hypothetical protein
MDCSNEGMRTEKRIKILQREMELQWMKTDYGNKKG